MLIFNELPTAFPWYDKLEKQNRYKSGSDGFCDYKLISPRNALLPFQFRRDTIKKNPVTWQIFNINTGGLVADISSLIGAKIRYRTLGAFDYFSYDGSGLTGLDLEHGYYYSRLTFTATSTPFYSEMFFVPVKSFLVTETAINYLKLVWYNSTDLNPFFFSDIVGGNHYFKNVVYLDTFIHASEPEISEDGTKDGEDTVIPTFQKATINYRITDLVPDFLKVAIILIQLHDNIVLTDVGGFRSGTIKNVSTNSSLEANGIYSTVDILFSQDLLIINKSCNDAIGADTGVTGWG